MNNRLGVLDRFVFFFLGIDPVGNKLGYFRTLVGVYWCGAILLGLIVILTTCVQNTTTVVMWALASAISMALLGFLFGIPKTSQENAPLRTAAPETTDTKPEAGAPATPKRIRHFVNTNLEEISDWLTKIIVGATLIQWKELLAAFTATAHTLAAAMSNDGAISPPNLALAYAIIVYFGATDFLFGYLFTRLFLAEAFTLADAQATVQQLSEEMRDVKVAVGDLQAKANANPTAKQGK